MDIHWLEQPAANVPAEKRLPKHKVGDYPQNACVPMPAECHLCGAGNCRTIISHNFQLSQFVRGLFSVTKPSNGIQRPHRGDSRPELNAGHWCSIAYLLTQLIIRVRSQNYSLNLSFVYHCLIAVPATRTLGKSGRLQRILGNAWPPGWSAVVPYIVSHPTSQRHRRGSLRSTGFSSEMYLGGVLAVRFAWHSARMFAWDACKSPR
jgi:hypothetical protein